MALAFPVAAQLPAPKTPITQNPKPGEPSILKLSTPKNLALPDFTFKGLRRADLKDDVMLIHIFGTWCPSCKIDHPLILSLKQYDIPLYGIAIFDTPTDTENFFKTAKNPYQRIGYDREAASLDTLGLAGVPATLLVTHDKNAKDPKTAWKIVWLLNGDLSKDHVLENDLIPAIKVLKQKSKNVSRETKGEQKLK